MVNAMMARRAWNMTLRKGVALRRKLASSMASARRGSDKWELPFNVFQFISNPCIHPVAHFDSDEDEDEDAQFYVHNMKCFLDDGEDGLEGEIDLKAEEFIIKFYEEMKLQHKVSVFQ